MAVVQQSVEAGIGRRAHTRSRRLVRASAPRLAADLGRLPRAAPAPGRSRLAGPRGTGGRSSTPRASPRPARPSAISTRPAAPHWAASSTTRSSPAPSAPSTGVELCPPMPARPRRQRGTLPIRRGAVGGRRRQRTTAKHHGPPRRGRPASDPAPVLGRLDREPGRRIHGDQPASRQQEEAEDPPRIAPPIRQERRGLNRAPGSGPIRRQDDGGRRSLPSRVAGPYSVQLTGLHSPPAEHIIASLQSSCPERSNSLSQDRSRQPLGVSDHIGASEVRPERNRESRVIHGRGSPRFYERKTRLPPPASSPDASLAYSTMTRR